MTSVYCGRLCRWMVRQGEASGTQDDVMNTRFSDREWFMLSCWAVIRGHRFGEKCAKCVSTFHDPCLEIRLSKKEEKLRSTP